MVRDLSRDDWLAMYDELLEEYADQSFQMKLHSRWHVLSDKMERYRMRMQLLLDVQAPVISKFGFEASRKGMTHCSASFQKYMTSGGDPEIYEKFVLASWWIDPDIQAAEPNGPSGNLWAAKVMYNAQPDLASDKAASKVKCRYKVVVTDTSSAAALTGVDACRATIVGEHQHLYKDIYPHLQPEAWVNFLGCGGSISEALDSGTMVLHAERTDTGQVVGYISCSCTSKEHLAHLDDGRAHRVAGDSFYKINHIVVLPEHRHRGVAKQMFAALVDFLKAKSPVIANDLRLNVLELNKDAIAWYKRLGFVRHEVRNLAVVGCPVKMLCMRRQGCSSS